MARIERGPHHLAGSEVVDARNRAAETFLAKHPDIRNQLLISEQSDLYSAVTTHISFDEDPGRRADLIRSLRDEFVRQPYSQLDNMARSALSETALSPIPHSGLDPSERMQPTKIEVGNPVSLKAGNSVVSDSSPSAHAAASNVDGSFYRQRGLQAYEDLMEGIAKLADEASAAIATAEHLAGNPRATDADFRASLGRVENLQAVIDRSIEGLKSSIVDRLSIQFTHEGIKLDVDAIGNIADDAILTAKIPRSLTNFANESRLYLENYEKLHKKRFTANLDAEKRVQAASTIELESSYDHRP